MKKFGIVLHGGASNSSKYLRLNLANYEAGLREAAQIGYKVLKKNGSALDAVELTVRYLEDNALFNAGRGSALNSKGEVEMDASIMDGKRLKAGAVSMVRSVKNPISLARIIMQQTKHVMLSGYGALELAINNKLQIEDDRYFITDHQYDLFQSKSKKESRKDMLQKRLNGTVGAVAIDKKGNLASATSTGGTTNCLPGRIGDSCIIGAGCYANNQTCAVSGTGQGEFLITGVIGHSISMYLEMTKCSLQQACDYVIHKRNKKIKQNIGIIAVDRKGNFGISFNTEIMKRAWVGTDGQVSVRIFK